MNGWNGEMLETSPHSLLYLSICDGCILNKMLEIRWEVREDGLQVEMVVGQVIEDQSDFYLLMSVGFRRF